MQGSLPSSSCDAGLAPLVELTGMSAEELAVADQLSLPWPARDGDRPAAWRALVDVLQLGRLVALDLLGNRMGDDAVIAVSDGLSGSALATLKLDWNLIGESGAAALATALASNRTLVELGLLGNRIGDAGAGHIGAALRTNRCLSKLYLGANGISDDGARALALSLSVNGALSELGLWSNAIGDDGAACLGRTGLVANAALRALDLDNNRIGDDGACALCEGLAANTTLAALLLGRNAISNRGAAAIAAALRAEAVPHMLTALDLRANMVDDDGVHALKVGWEWPGHRQMCGLSVEL
jgi:hypothetical protein